MSGKLRLKLFVSLVVFVVFAAIGVYPIVAERCGIRTPKWLKEQQLKLGLDLKGGVHLVLRVRTEEALRLETATEMERLREEIAKRGFSGVHITQPDSIRFRVEGVSPAQEAAFRETVTDVQANFDRSSGGGGTYVFTMKPNVQVTLREMAVAQNRESIERRVNELGVTEPSIARQGRDGDQIVVQLPGVTEVDRARDIIRLTGLLEITLVERGPAPPESLLVNGLVPGGLEIVSGLSTPGEAPGSYLLHTVAAVTGKDLRNARPTVDENNQPAVAFTLNSDGARRFAKVTGENIGRSLAIVLDKRVQSVARIDSTINREGRIYGAFTPEDVQNLSVILRSGALSAPMDYLEEQVIGPSLGADSIRSGVMASVVGLTLVMSFMLAYYRLSGVNAVVALIFNLVILLGLMAYIGAVMTLPGIAGFVLTMGIGVDSNVLIFERIKEEIEARHGVRASIRAGFSRVFWTLVDTHVAALISSGFLFQFGTGPIRGFAMTLFIGLVSNLFTSIFVSKTLFELALSRRVTVETLSI
jgi:preprotein translocase subunit SecD